MSDTPSSLLRSTPLLDTEHPDIERLVADRGWRALPERERIGAVYDFVRNEIAFGYNEADDLPASRVLADGHGQCNTKGTLLMALLRSVGVPCRFHGFTIDKALQKGAITGAAYVLAPRRIIHSWVEVWFEGRWVCLEGFILDAQYLRSLQRRFPGARRFCGFGAATRDLSAPDVEWRGQRSGAGFSDSGVSEVSATMGHSARRSREHETTPPQPLSGLQGQGGDSRRQGRADAGSFG